MASFKAPILLFLTFATVVASADHHSEKFTVSCAIKLIGGNSGKPSTDNLASEAKHAYEQALVKFDLGDYSLIAMSVAKLTPSNEMIPTLDVSLTKSGNPIQGQVNYATTPVEANVGDTRSVSSFSFLNLTYKGQIYSRIDYTCAMTRTE